MTDFTDYTENLTVEWLVGGTDFPASHSNVYVGLHTADPTDSGEDNEVTASSYSRASTVAGSDWTINGGTFENNGEIQFPIAQENWGTVSHFTLWDGSPNDGTNNALAVSSLDSSKEIREGDQPVFRDGVLTGQVD